jgi:hypothetical protein
MDEQMKDDVTTDVDVYAICVTFGIPGYDVPDADLAAHLDAVKADIEYAQKLLGDPAVDLAWSDYDHHDGGCISYLFETVNEEVAKKYEFTEVMHAGAEDYEPAPWSWAMQPADDEDRATLAAMIEKATALGIDIEKAYKTYGLVGTETPTTNGQVDRAYCALKYAIDQVEKAQAALKSAQATLAQAVRS